MRHIENEIDKLVYDEYGDKLDAKDKEIEEKNKKLETQNKKLKTQTKEIYALNKTNKKYKENIKKLSKIKDLNSPKAKELINSLASL